MVSTNQFKNGMHVDVDGTIFKIVEFQHVKPGKGGAFVRTKLKKVAGGAVVDRTFRADEKVPLAVIDKREMQYLYGETDAFVFMDNETYDQLHVEKTDLGGSVNYLKEGDTAILMMYSGRVVGIELPAAVPESLVVIALGALSTIFVLVRLISIPDEFFFAGRGIGLVISLVAALALLIAGVLEAAEEL